MNKEQNWHNDRYKDQGNTCGQDTFYYCSELYNPKKSFSNSYTDYSDCVTEKTTEDCGHDFTTAGPNQWSGGKNPYLLALQADSQHLEDKINELEDYDPSVGYDSDELIEEWNDEHPQYEYGDDSIINQIDDSKQDKELLYIGIGVVSLITIITLI